MSRQRRASWLACLCVCLLASTASAQPFGKAVVATFGVGGREPALAAANEVEAQLAARHLPLISMHDARDRFSATSRPPQGPSGSDLEALAKEARRAVQHVAFGRTAAAEQSVRDIVALAERSLETLNRQTKNARQLLDACLALVRSSLHEGQREEAIEQAMRCRRLVPDLAPSESAHPANVVGVLAEADDQLRRMRVGSLSVRNVPARTCSVYLNGRHLGTTPFALDRAAVGAYRVQVECKENEPGRVHVVQLGDEPVELLVDMAFDQTVVTEPRLGLRYEDASALSAALVSNAVQLGREVRAEDLVLVKVEGQRAELVRVNVKHRRLTAATHVAFDSAHGFQASALRAAIDQLVQGRFVGLAPDHYAPAPGAEPPVAPSPQNVALAATRSSTSSRPDRPAPEQAKPVYKKWWLWTTVGLVVAGGVAAGVVFGLRDHGKASEEPVIDVPER